MSEQGTRRNCPPQPVYPLQSGSVASKRTKCASGDLDLIETCPTLDRHSPLRSPDVDAIGRNLLAIRVMVTSDGSSSEAEAEPRANPSDSEAMVASCPGASLSGPLANGLRLRARTPQSKEESQPGQSNSKSKAQEALRRAHSFNTPASNRQEKWRKKIQIKLPLLLRKKVEPAARESGLNGANPAEDKDHVAQVPSVHSPSHLRMGYLLPNWSPWQQRAVKDAGLAVTAPHPHRTSRSEAPLTNRELQQPQASHSARETHKLSTYCSGGSEEEGEEVASDSHFRASLIAKDEDALVPETSPSSERQGTEHASHSKFASTGAVGMREAILQKLTSMDGQSRGSVKRLVDSPARPPQSLDRISSITSNTTTEKQQKTEEAKRNEDNVGEVDPTKCDRKIPSEPKTKSSGSPILTEPIDSTNSDMHSPPESPKMEDASSNGNTPGNDSPKSPLSFLVNAFRRSFFDSKSSVFSNSVERTQEKKPKMRQARPFANSSFHGLSLNVFNSSTQDALSSEDRGHPCTVMQQPPVANQHRDLPSIPLYRPALGVFHNSSWSNSSTEDSSKITENENQQLSTAGKEKDHLSSSGANISLKEGDSGQIKPELNFHTWRNNALFSSLRLGSPTTENNEKPALAMDDTMVTASKNDIWRLMASFKKKSFRDSEMKEPLPSACISTISSALQNAKGLNMLPGSKDLKIVTQVTKGESESSSDEPSEENFSLRRREGQSFRRRRKMQNIVLQQVKHEEVRRLHRAQIIQRQLQEVEEKQRVLEECGVLLEKALRGESELGSKEEPQQLQKWFKLAMEKNALVRFEAELMIFARELELEDQQSRLQQMLRDRMAVDDTQKTEQEIAEEKGVLNEMLDVIEQRDKLVVLLEEQRLQEKEEDRDVEGWVMAKGYKFNWS